MSTASLQVSGNVQTVASSMEQMSASVREISKSAGDAAFVATAAVETAESADATFAKLDCSSIEIGNVLKVITSIAEETNLLALRTLGAISLHPDADSKRLVNRDLSPHPTPEKSAVRSLALL